MGCGASANQNMSQNCQDENSSANVESAEGVGARVYFSEGGEPTGACGEWRQGDDGDGRQSGQRRHDEEAKAVAEEETREVSMTEEAGQLQPEKPSTSAALDQKELQPEDAQGPSQEGLLDQAAALGSGDARPASAIAMLAGEQARGKIPSSDEEDLAGLVTVEKPRSVAMYVPSGVAVNAATPLPSCLQKKRPQTSWKSGYDLEEKQLIASAFRQENLNRRTAAAKKYEQRRSQALCRRELMQMEAAQDAAKEPTEPRGPDEPK